MNYMKQRENSPEIGQNELHKTKGERIHRREDKMNYIKDRERGRENSPEIGRNELHQRKRERGRENSPEIGRNELHQTKRERERKFT